MPYDPEYFLNTLADITGRDKSWNKAKIKNNNISDIKSEVGSVNLNPSSGKLQFLGRYLNQLQDKKEEAKRIKLIKENFSEIEDIFDTLQDEVDKAIEEERTLEQLAEDFDDKKVHRKIENYDKPQIRKLNRKLKHLIKIKKEMEKREQKVEEISNEFNHIYHALEQRIDLIDDILSRNSGGGGSNTFDSYDCFNCGEDGVYDDSSWDDPDNKSCPNCGVRLDWNDLNWSNYNISDWRTYIQQKNSDQIPPWQGWKIHISARPSEAKPIIQKMMNKFDKHTHKFAKHPREMAEWEGNDSNQGKVMTIYPSIDSGKERIATCESSNKLRVIQSPSDQSEARLNRDFINSNKKNAERIVDKLLSELRGIDKVGAELSKYRRGIKITDPSYEQQIGNTRIFVRYDHIGNLGRSNEGGLRIGSQLTSGNIDSSDVVEKKEYGPSRQDQHIVDENGQVNFYYKGDKGFDKPNLSGIGAEKLKQLKYM